MPVTLGIHGQLLIFAVTALKSYYNIPPLSMRFEVHSDDHECDAVKSARSLLIFWRSLLSPCGGTQ
jgi:hypothetical protein